MGNPEKKRICTSHIERQNLTIRMQMRRMTRLQQKVGQPVERLLP
jgi:IS1 family transposase